MVSTAASTQRWPIVGTNLKMMMTPSQAATYATELRMLTDDVAAALFVLPSFPALAPVAGQLDGSHIAWGAQDVHPDDRGAHTGMVSAPMLADVGCTYVLVGHYERRRDQGESNELVAAKAIAAQRWGMEPIICIGEADRESVDRCFDVVEAQLQSLRGVDLTHSVLAYEPGWAIGVGSRPAAPEWISDMHTRIRHALADLFYRADMVPIISGGSIDGGNATTVAGLPNVDGLFVGRSALDPARFSDIIRSVAQGCVA